MADVARATLQARITNAPLCAANGIGEAALTQLRNDCRNRHGPLFDVLDDAGVARLLAGVFDASPYLMQLATADFERLARTLATAPEDRFYDLTVELRATMRSAESSVVAKRALRHYKSAVALLTALADLGGVWPVMTVTRMLSETADAAVSETVRFLFRTAVAKGQWAAGDDDAPDATSGYFVLAMGKHGGFELNYSSDIDLIVFFDRARSSYAGNGDVQSFFVRLTRELVLLLEERTADGYVFRTDLRLRPDAGATQVALSTSAAHHYYETVGQNWERAALIKARCCAGDGAAGGAFLRELSPFIWRKYLDFAAIDDIHAMKRQIHAHKGFGGIAVFGHNIKLGRGGIREIEFFAQTQQLIAGGRQSDLRVRATLDALDALEKRGWVRADVRGELAAAYEFLRRLEHRLQMIADEQTHDMPDRPDGLQRVALFSGFADGAALALALTRVLETVERHYAGLFEGAPELTGAGTNMVFAGATDDPDTLAELKRLGFSQPTQVLAIVRGWHHGRTPAVRSEKARELLTEVQPMLIESLADTVDPDGAVASFDRFLAELPAGVQLFSLLKANPTLLRLIADIMGSTPRLARILSRRRRLLDAVLDPRAMGGEISAEAIDDVIARAFNETRRVHPDDGMQGLLDTARVIGGEEQFLIGVRVLTGSITAAEAGVAYAILAERLVAALLAATLEHVEIEHGRVAGGEAVVVALGKLGGREMTASSDLDLIVIYDFDAGAEQSDGGRPLAPSHYYQRLTQRLINALSAPTAEGSLYDVDMRLRPSGQKGPVATRLSAFTAYHSEDAWTWEHLALTRARVIAGPAALAHKVEAAIHAVLVAPRERVTLTADVRDMRLRIAAEKGTTALWDLKQVRGGLVDLEFIAQYLQLANAATTPEILDQTTLIALEKMVAPGVLSADDERQLRIAGRLLHDLTQVLRLSLDVAFDPATAPKGLKALLSRAGGARDFADLETRLRAATDSVQRLFDRLIA